MGDLRQLHIIGGGTVFHVRNHLALAAPAYGATARMLNELCWAHSDRLDVKLHLTRMAGGPKHLETNDDVAQLVEGLVGDPLTKVIFMNAAMCDFTGSVRKGPTGLPLGSPSGKYEERLRSDEFCQLLLNPAPKVISGIRRSRKDIFLVGFKTTCGLSEDRQYRAGLKLLKDSSCNLVLANDVQTRTNMVVTPEEARYHVTMDREEALRALVEMTYLRSHLTFTRSTVVGGEPIAWTDPRVPGTLREVVDHCIASNAYKPFGGVTVGHFACKLDDVTFLTSRRRTNFNNLRLDGLVLVKTDGPDSVIAFGSKPSVGGQSQRIIFEDHPEYDCIVHFHCPKLPGSRVPSVSQREFECGSHECGQNTSRGLMRFGALSAVFLEEHGPNIVFHHSIDPREVIRFIDENFDLSDKTGGYVT